jgi:hypothetical protein
MSELYDSKGVKRENTYILLDEHIFDQFVIFALLYGLYHILTWTFNRKEIQLNCTDGPLEVLVWGDLPNNICTSLARNIRMALAVEGHHPLEAMDSSKTPGIHGFEAIHFDYYVQNATKVHVFLSKLCNVFTHILSGT